MSIQESPCAVWDITIPAHEVEDDEKHIINWCKEHCKKWCFQKEEGGQTGYVHYQCRVSLVEKVRRSGILGLMKEAGFKGHLSKTSNNGRKSEFYVTKTATRIAGPWSDRDPEPPYIPKQYRGEPIWYGWQKKMIYMLEQEPDERKVTIVVDTKGNHGKSYLSNWLACRGRARRIPAINDYKDIMRMVLDTPNCKTYFVDIPRAFDKAKLKGIYSAIETIKDGNAYDERYKWQEKWYDTPHVFVFTNKYPDMNMLSIDRWDIWDISDEDQFGYKENEDSED